MTRPSLALRSPLRWLLGLSALLSAVAIGWPDDVSRAASSQGAAPWQSPPSPVTPDRPVVAGMRLPERLPVHTLDKATFDPFVGLQPPPPPPPKIVVAPVVVSAPMPPQLAYRYLGQMTDPSGQQRHFLARMDKDVPVAVGTLLDEGYVVEAITTDAIRLHYPPLNTRVEIRIPPSRDPSASQ